MGKDTNTSSISWREMDVAWSNNYPLTVRTDGTRWQIATYNYIPTPQGPLEEYMEELKLCCSGIIDPVLDCWIQGTEGEPELHAEVRGWRDATSKETERIERKLKKK